MKLHCDYISGNPYSIQQSVLYISHTFIKKISEKNSTTKNIEELEHFLRALVGATMYNMSELYEYNGLPASEYLTVRLHHFTNESE